MKKAGIYCMLVTVAVFLFVSFGILTSRSKPRLLTQYGALTITASNTVEAGENKVISDGKLNINTAGMKELEQLPGIGNVLAQRIIEYRQNHGGFESIDELLEVKGIGPSKLNAIKAYITVN